jgi:hypothetical protein
LNFTDVQNLFNSDGAFAWNFIREKILSLYKNNHALTLNEAQASEQTVAEIDHLLSASCWDLWQGFQKLVPRTSERLVEWWNQESLGKAVLVLDGLSMRELGAVIQGATENRFEVVNVDITASEIPGDTTPFANALGLPARASLENNKAPGTFVFSDAFTETTNSPFRDVGAILKPKQALFIWHHWPDIRMHQLEGDGSAYRKLHQETTEQFLSKDFWGLVSILAEKRSVIITSDHGYAVSGAFPDVPDSHGKILKEAFKGGRWCDSQMLDDLVSIPPYFLELVSEKARVLQVLGQRKWKSPGGYPRLVHGGLTLLECLSPFIELRKG